MTDFPDFGRDIRPTLFTLTGNTVKLVAATGTRVQLSATSVIASVAMIKARKRNVGTVYVGTSTVTNDEAATGGYQLDQGDAMVISGTDLSTVYVNGTAGDGVSVAWWV